MTDMQGLLSLAQYMGKGDRLLCYLYELYNKYKKLVT